jgi:predicted RNA-binding protein with PUA-like domain
MATKKSPGAQGGASSPGLWLFKSEPGNYCYADLERDGTTVWDGVGNNLALIHLRQARSGDQAFLYHTGDERAVVGIVTVTSDPYPDPALQDPKRAVVDVRPEKRLGRLVTLAEIKADPAFAGWLLLTHSRLSVMPVPAPLWQRILELGG